MKRLIIFDIDGTLYDNRNDILYPSTIECIKKLKEKGHEICIASGRNIKMIDHIKPLFPYIDDYIMINGKQIIADGKEVYRKPMDKKALKSLLDDFEKNDIPYGCVSSNGYRINKTNKDVLNAYRDFKLGDMRVDDKYYDREDIFQIWCFGSDERINEFSKLHQEYEFKTWGNEGFDVLERGENKAKCIKWLCNYRSIDIKSAISVGDGINDIEMISQVGIGIAVGNANPELKKCAKIITDDISNNGIYKVFKELDLI